MKNEANKMLLAGLVFALTCTACTTHDPQERVTGSAGKLVRYSSQQIKVDMSESRREMLAQLRDQEFAAASYQQGVDAVAAALTAGGYGQVDAEADTGLIRAEKGEVLAPKWRELMRGMLRSKIGILPAKPDHQMTMVLVTVKEHGNRVLIRARFERTIWDSNGDAKTNEVTDEQTYASFFRAVSQVLKNKSTKQD